VARYLSLVLSLETTRGLAEEDRWRRGDENWEKAEEGKHKVEYHKALRALELECVQRLAEMDKNGF
jgi:hypothetical protein